MPCVCVNAPDSSRRPPCPGHALYAVGAGEVIASGPASGYGQWIRILHDDGTVTEYGHLYQRDVAVGQYVQAPMSVSALTCTAGPTTPSS
ncbi:M23 family metallopeptidase [Streptomyces longwoodensis]|uniref:M23 family metallopeptidase n=1 Tax=Streptomyces longwoodensis TaxID=68231 RepID=UPI00340DD461